MKEKDKKKLFLKVKTFIKEIAMRFPSLHAQIKTEIITTYVVTLMHFRYQKILK